PAPAAAGGGVADSSGQLHVRGGGPGRFAVAARSQAGGAQLAPALQPRREEIPQEHGGEHGVRADHVGQVAHASPPASLRTQSLPASRRRLSARARASSEPANQNLVPITIHHSGAIMLASMLDWPNTRMVWPWCRESHHSTE